MMLYVRYAVGLELRLPLLEENSLIVNVVCSDGYLNTNLRSRVKFCKKQN